MITVGQVITISLRDQVERRALAQKEIKKLGLETKWFLADPDPTGDSIKGCFNSHVSVAKIALEKQLKTILVFEDDVKILPCTQKKINAINQFIKKKYDDFDLLYLGFILGKIWHYGNSSIVRANGPASHAYILSPTGIRKIANYRYDQDPIDEVMRKTLKCYSVYPFIADQQSEKKLTSSITEQRNRFHIHRTKDEQYWQNNFNKQKKRLWENIHLSLWEIIYNSIVHPIVKIFHFPT